MSSRQFSDQSLQLHEILPGPSRCARREAAPEPGLPRTRTTLSCPGTLTPRDAFFPY